ncbi:MAG: histidinol-phosphate aminotransferase family protein [Acidobacteria bacterium]|nr:histidinol-phosphate aminotransferase family protein [Acidobacteriota bacterium]
MTQEAYHGGAFFDAIGMDLLHLERAAGIISADVLDAWFDPSPRVLRLLSEHLSFLLRTSPPNHAEGLVAEIALRRGVPEACLLPGSGSSSLLFGCLPRMLPERPRVLTLAPMYTEYGHIAGDLMGGSVHHLELLPANGFAIDGEALLSEAIRLRPHAVLLVNPNNPTGRLWPRAGVLQFLDRAPQGTLVVVDETYIDYAGVEQSLEREVANRPDLVVVKSMSKVYALSGARVAYMAAHPGRAAALRPWLPPWPVGLLAQAAAMEALRDPAYYQARYAETHGLRTQLRAALRHLQPYPSEANFFLIEPPEPEGTAARLRERGIFLREFPDGPLAGRYLRVTVKDGAQNERIVEALA